MEFLLILLSPMLWASATLTDKMLVSGDGADSKPGALMAISGFFNLVFGLLILLPILAFNGQIGDIVGMRTEILFPLLFNGITQTVAMILFLKALTIEEVSRVDPWFQTIPVFGIMLAFVFIGESLAWYQVAAIAILAVGGWTIMSKGVAGRKVVGLMVTAAFLLAVNDVVFAKFGRELDTMPAIFCDVTGKAFFGLILLVGPKTRQGFVIGLRTKFKLQTISEVLFIAADFFFDRAKLFAPVAIVQGVACTQPMFTIIGAALLTRFFPKLLAEEQGVAFWKKLGGISLIVIGGGVIAVTHS
jgi:drug/metabolite transporter (DMT)-like permease